MTKFNQITFKNNIVCSKSFGSGIQVMIFGIAIVLMHFAQEGAVSPIYLQLETLALINRLLNGQIYQQSIAFQE